MNLTAAHTTLLADRPDLVAKMTTGPLRCCAWGDIVTALQKALVEAPKIISILEVILSAVEPLVEAAA